MYQRLEKLEAEKQRRDLDSVYKREKIQKIAKQLKLAH